jgi:hypothetical protein
MSIRSFAGNDNADAAAEWAKAVPAGATVLVAAIDLEGTHAVSILEALANGLGAVAAAVMLGCWTRMVMSAASKVAVSSLARFKGAAFQ